MAITFCGLMWKPVNNRIQVSSVKPRFLHAGYVIKTLRSVFHKDLIGYLILPLLGVQVVHVVVQVGQVRVLHVLREIDKKLS